MSKELLSKYAIALQAAKRAIAANSPDANKLQEIAESALKDYRNSINQTELIETPVDEVIQPTDISHSKKIKPRSKTSIVVQDVVDSTEKPKKTRKSKKIDK